MLAGGQSLVPMLALRLAVFEHLVDIGRIAELQGIERRDGALWIGAGTTQARVERERRRRGGGAAARAGDAVHRPLPDPQPRHARRLDRARRPGRRVPGRRARRSTRRWRSCRRAVAARIAARDFFDGLWSTTSSPTSSSSACRSRSGAGAAASRSRSSPAGTATSRSRAPTSASSSTTTTGSGAARSGSSVSGRRPSAPTAAEAELTGRPIARRRARRGRSPRDGRPRRRSRPTCTAPPSTARGSARRWWRAPGRRAGAEAARCLRSSVRLTVNGAGAARDRRAAR